MTKEEKKKIIITCIDLWDSENREDQQLAWNIAESQEVDFILEVLPEYFKITGKRLRL